MGWDLLSVFDLAEDFPQVQGESMKLPKDRPVTHRRWDRANCIPQKHRVRASVDVAKVDDLVIFPGTNGDRDPAGTEILSILAPLRRALTDVI